MQQLSDRELVEKILTGREDALAELFDRYASLLYEFIYRVVGDRDQAARLLEEIFARVPSAFAPLPDSDNVRGWLYNFAREASLTFLRQEDSLKELPPTDESFPPGLRGEIERAARAMPAFHRAALVVEELHGLSPSEKSIALNVPRTDLSGLIADARHSFKFAFDSQPIKSGAPLDNAAELERILGARRRLGTQGSLFGYLPPIGMPESLATKIRSRLAPHSGIHLRVTPEDAKLITIPPPESFKPPPEPPPPEPVVQVIQPTIEERARAARLSERQVALIIAATLMLAFVITAIAPGVGYLVSRDTTPPTVTRIEPEDGAKFPIGSRVVISATYADERAVASKGVRLVVDGDDVTAQANISEAALSYSFNPNPGVHSVLLELKDNSDNQTARTWQFQVLPAPTETPLATPPLPPTATATPTATTTPTVTGTLPAVPAIRSFTANQTTISRGTSVLFNWSVAGATQVFLNQERVDATGSRLVTPNRTTTYQLTANNALGATTNSITVVVQEFPDLIVSNVSLNAVNQILFTVRNDGAGDVSKGFLIQVTANGITVYSDRPVTSLPAAQEARLSVSNYTVVGTQNISVQVNTQREVEESNYSNNELVRSLTGATPTLPPTLAPTLTPFVFPTSTPFPTSTAVIIQGCINGTVQDNAGRPLPGWTINLDWGENGVLLHRSTLSDANGSYRFDNLTPGLSYSLSEALQPDWIPLTPTLWTLGVAPSSQCSNIVFINQLPTPVPTATTNLTMTPTRTRTPTSTPTFNCITGIKADEHGDHLPYWTMVLDYVDENGIARRLTTVTDRNGWFWFPYLKKGLTYTVSEVMQTGWEAVYPTSFVVVLDGCPELIFKNRFVGFAGTPTPGPSPTATPVLGCITGIKADESGAHLAGWTILLDWTDEKNQARHLSALTDSNGWFGFAGLRQGLVYSVTEVKQPGWDSIFPTTYVIVLDGCPELLFKNKFIGSTTPTPTLTPTR